MINDLWYKNAVIYCCSIETFLDSNGDGIGDFEGLSRRLDYLQGLGVTAVWLARSSPRRGATTATTSPTTTRSTRATARSATSSSSPTAPTQRGIRVIIDLVVNHTSDQHPWFRSAPRRPELAVPRLVRLGRQEAARRQEGHRVPRRAEDHLDPRRQGREVLLPPLLRVPAGPQHHQPRGAGRDPEDHRLLGAARRRRVPHRRGAVRDRPASIPRPARRRRATTCCATSASSLQWRQGDAVLLAEANVTPEREHALLRRRRRPHADDVQLPGQPAPVLRARHRRQAAARARRSRRPASCPTTAQWALHLRNHDELDLGRLTDAERAAGLRRLRPEAGDAALRPRHPPPARADARRRPAAARARLQPAVHPARDAGHPLRRRDRHGRRPRRCPSATARARRCSGRPSRTAASPSPTSRRCR